MKEKFLLEKIITLICKCSQVFTKMWGKEQLYLHDLKNNALWNKSRFFLLLVSIFVLSIEIVIQEIEKETGLLCLMWMVTIFSISM